MPQVIRRKRKMEGQYAHPLGTPWAVRIAYKDLKGVHPEDVDVFVRGYGFHDELLYQRVGTYAGAIRDHYEDGDCWSVFSFEQVNDVLIAKHIILVVEEKGDEE